MIIAIDTMVAIRMSMAPTVRTNRSSDAQKQAEEESFRAKLLLRIAEEKEWKIVLPSLAMAELLVPVPPPDHATLINLLRKSFIIPPFDDKVASLAAELRSKRDGLAVGERSVIKADIFIIAQAACAGAVRFYSCDSGCRAVANLTVAKGHELPRRTDDLFTEGEIRSGEL